jgi:hypothetical protein
MSDALRIGWTVDQVVSARNRYRRLLGIVLVFELLLGLAALVAPSWLARLVAVPMPSPNGWIRLFGLQLLIMAAFSVPGWFNPAYARWTNAVGIVARLALAILCGLLGGGLSWLAGTYVVAGTALAVSYVRMLRSELMSRP